MWERAGRAMGAVAVALLLLSGCTPSPSPAATTAAPLTDEQAFAAAEKTYRAYVDALNQVDLSDPATFEPVYDWTDGTFENEERKDLSTMHADGWAVSGASLIDQVEFVEHAAGIVTMNVCLDVSGVALTDSTGASVVAADRPEVQQLSIKVGPAETPTGLAVTESSGSAEPLPC